MGAPIHDPTSDDWFFENVLLQPPAPAPGDPILTSAETNDLNLMLQDMVSNTATPGVHEFGHHFTDDDWTNDPPPHLINLSSSYGPLDGLSPNAFYHDVQPRNPATTSSAMLPASAASAPPGTFGVSDATLAAAPITNTTSDPTLSTAPSMASSASYYPSAASVPPQHSPVHQHTADVSQPTDDVLNAAISLTQHGYHARSNSMSSGPGFSNVSQRPANQTMGPPVGHLRHQPLDEFVQEGRRMSQSTDLADQQAVMKFWMSGGKQSSERTPGRKPAPLPLQYGSDQSFSNSNQPFVPRTKKESSEAMHEEHLKYMECVKLAPNSGTGSPTTAIFNGNNIPPLNLKTRGPSTSLKIEANGDYSNWTGGRSGGDDEDDEVEEPQSAVSKTSGRKRKSKGGSSNSPITVDGAPAGKRRKSTAASKRENLTEDQKRENHINSEKKRRKVIQTGFDNLGILVPNLKGGNQSKSIMLDSTVAFIKELLAGNEQLNAQLCQL